MGLSDWGESMGMVIGCRIRGWGETTSRTQNQAQRQAPQAFMAPGTLTILSLLQVKRKGS